MEPTFAFLPAAVLLAFAASAQVKITPGPEKISVEINGKPFTEFFMAGDQVVKPYLFPLRAATGTYITRMWPLEKVAEEEKMFEANTIKQDHPHPVSYTHLARNGRLSADLPNSSTRILSLDFARA